MDVAVVVLVVSLLLAGILGFSAERASICTVRAVAEILTTRRAFMLLSFAKTVLWVMVVTLALGWLVPVTERSAWTLSLHALAGGLVFGLGAAVNGGCAFSTLTRLASGQLSMAVTLSGLCFGAAGFHLLASKHLLPAPAAAPKLEPDALSAILILGVLILWAGWEGLRLWRTRRTGSTLKELVFADRYRLSTAALLMGASNAFLYALYDTWTYTSVLDRSVRQMMGSSEESHPLHWALFAAVFAGMLLSVRIKGRFRPDWRPSVRWLLHLGGGLMMGLGAAMVPGGNDVLILSGIPGLSPHAVPAYLTMIAGIAFALAVMGVLGGKVPQVSCRGDICSYR